MRQVQVTVPDRHRELVEEILQDYSTDISSSKVERKEEESIQFSATVEASDIDDLTEDLKGHKEIEVGELSIRVLQQETLIEKGQQTKGSTSPLSQEEIYSKAQEFRNFTKPQWGLIALSSAIASYGLVLDNVILVIGAMMLAPMLSPFVSGAVSLAVGDRSLLIDSVRAGIESAVIAVLVSYLAVFPIPVGVNNTLELVVSPGVPTVLLSLLVGGAAALTFATGLRDQIAGVAVAIALVPPLASVGIALKMQDFVLAFQAAAVAFSNILGVIISGFISFNALGLRPQTYYKKRNAEKMKYVVPGAFLVLIVLVVPVVYHAYANYEAYGSQHSIEKKANQFFGEDLIEIRFKDSTATILVAGDHNETEFRRSITGDVKLEVIELRKAG
ncbi:MAG: TIGR00341 family protein [Candidatus Nanohaloarchaea archaeon]